MPTNASPRDEIYAVVGGKATLAARERLTSVTAVQASVDEPIEIQQKSHQSMLFHLAVVLAALLVLAASFACDSSMLNMASSAPIAPFCVAGASIGGMQVISTGALVVLSILTLDWHHRVFRPVASGAGFVLFRIISWACIGTGLALQGVYLASLVVVELELFVGAMLVAGLLLAASHVVMMLPALISMQTTNVQANAGKEAEVSVLDERLNAFVNECFGILAVATLANLQHFPNALIFVLYSITTRLELIGVLVYGLGTIAMEILIFLARMIGTRMYDRDLRSGKEKATPSRYRFKYVLPRLLIGLVPVIITRYHYIHNMEALIPVAMLSVFAYVYEFTFHGEPQLTGSRMRADWVTSTSVFVEAIKRYFSAEIIRSAPLDPTSNYILAFHPHGISPLTASWLQLSDEWRRLFPGVHAHVLTATVMHHVPIMRDVAQFFGSREVTRQAFVSTLCEHGSVLVVPGGQAELIAQQSQQKQVRVYTQHKGFIRLAIEHGVPLVPILSFKEGEILDNVRMPELQQWFIKKAGFPFPYLPYGRWLLPIPRKINITVAVGAPLDVEKVADPTTEMVAKVHAEYFQRLAALFDKYKDAAGCSDYELVLL